MSKSEKSKQIQLRDDTLLALTFVGDRFKYIEKIFDELEEVLDKHFGQDVDLQECFQRGHMEIENIRDEVSEQLRKFAHPEQKEV